MFSIRFKVGSRKQKDTMRKQKSVLILPAKQYHNVYWSLSCSHIVVPSLVTAHYKQLRFHHISQCKRERDVLDGYPHTSLQFQWRRHILEMRDSSVWTGTLHPQAEASWSQLWIINSYECMIMKADIKNKVYCFWGFYFQWHEPHEIELVSLLSHTGLLSFLSYKKNG